MTLTLFQTAKPKTFLEMAEALVVGTTQLSVNEAPLASLLYRAKHSAEQDENQLRVLLICASLISNCAMPKLKKAFRVEENWAVLN